MPTPATHRRGYPVRCFFYLKGIMMTDMVNAINEALPGTYTAESDHATGTVTVRRDGEAVCVVSGDDGDDGPGWFVGEAGEDVTDTGAADWYEEDDTEGVVAAVVRVCETGQTVCGASVQQDHSGGQGHCWRDIAADDIFAPVREEIAAEIIDGNETCDGYRATNGQYYRW